MELSPKVPQKVSESDGGAYYTWYSSQFALLSEAKVGAGKLLLHPLGLAIPHYSDSAKIGYVVQGTGTAGMISPKEPKEAVYKMKQGDIIAVPLGVVSWWFNDGDSDLVILFLGETTTASHAGDFSYFFLAGTQGIFNGFSNEFVSKSFNLKEEEVEELMNSQKNSLITKLKERQGMPEPCNYGVEEKIVNIDDITPEVETNGGTSIAVTSSKLPFLGEIGLSVNLVKLNADAVYSPVYCSSSAFELTCIVKGSGRVQIVGVNGKRVLDADVKADCLFIVPRSFATSKIAGKDGMEWVSIITDSHPSLAPLSGKTSVWTALSPKVLQASLNVSPEVVNLFKSRMSRDAIFVPPPN